MDTRATNPQSTGSMLLDKSTAKPGTVDMSIFEKKSTSSLGQGTVSSGYLQKSREDDPWPADSSGAAPAPAGAPAPATQKVSLTNCKITTGPDDLATDKPFEMSCDVAVVDAAKPPTNFTVFFKLYSSIVQADGTVGAPQFMNQQSQGTANQTAATQTVTAKGSLVSPTPPVRRGTKIRYYVEAEHWDCPGVKLKSAEVEVTNNLLPKPVTNWALHPIHFDFDSSAILPTAAEDLPQLKKMMDDNPDTLLSIFGHADPVGDDEYNKKLSVRRAKMLYALLTRNTAIWIDLSKKVTGDEWGVKTNQRMLSTVKDSSGAPYYAGAIDGIAGDNTTKATKKFQGDNGLFKDGVIGPKTKTKLFAAYMDAVCVDSAGSPYTVAADKFMGDPAENQKTDAKAKGAYQGCSELNPVYLMSNSDIKGFESKPDKTARNKKNQPNRRTVVALFKKDDFSETDAKKPQWPCPDSGQPCAKCNAEFWTDGDVRRKSTDAERKYPDDQTTMACMFYSGVAEKNIEKTTTKPDIEIKTEDGSKAAAQEMMIGTAIKWKGVPKDGMTGTFKWSSTSTRLELSNQDTDTLSIKAKTDPSADGKPEEIKLEFLPTGIQSPMILTYKLKVFQITVDETKVTFGFDANESIIPPAIPTPPPTQRGAIQPPFKRTPEKQPFRVSVKSGSETDLVFVIKGGPVDIANFEFEIADTAKATVSSKPATGTAAPYTVKIKGGSGTKVDTPMVVKHVPTGQECMKFDIRVYKELACEAVILLIEDSTNATTSSQSKLDCRTMSPSVAQAGINKTYKFAVANLTLQGSAARPGTPPTYHVNLALWSTARQGMIYNYEDHSNDGVKKIKDYVASQPAFAGKQIVAVVKQMKTFMRLKADVAANTNEVTIGGAGAFFAPGNVVTLGEIMGSTTNDDTMTIQSVTAVTGTSNYKVKFTANFAHAHATNTHGITFNAAGWSGNLASPILCAEGTSSQQMLIETAGHELGHALLGYKDVEDNRSIMNYMIGVEKAELHFEPMIKRYQNENYTSKENQWDLLPRT